MWQNKNTYWWLDQIKQGSTCSKQGLLIYIFHRIIPCRTKIKSQSIIIKGVICIENKIKHLTPWVAKCLCVGNHLWHQYAQLHLHLVSYPWISMCMQNRASKSSLGIS